MIDHISRCLSKRLDSGKEYFRRRPPGSPLCCTQSMMGAGCSTLMWTTPYSEQETLFCDSFWYYNRSNVNNTCNFFLISLQSLSPVSNISELNTHHWQIDHLHLSYNRRSRFFYFNSSNCLKSWSFLVGKTQNYWEANPSEMSRKSIRIRMRIVKRRDSYKIFLRKIFFFC